MVDFASLKSAAEKALRHSGKSEWIACGRVVTGFIGAKPFVVASVDDLDEIPVCAGKAIANFIEASQPSVVLALIAEIERCHARLEIDREYEAVGDTLVERRVPYAERVGMTDGIACRDATIALMRAQIEEQRAEIERRESRLQSHREVYKAGFDAGIAAAIASTNDDNDTNRERIQVQAAIESKRLEIFSEGADEEANA